MEVIEKYDGLVTDITNHDGIYFSHHSDSESTIKEQAGI